MCFAIWQTSTRSVLSGGVISNWLSINQSIVQGYGIVPVPALEKTRFKNVLGFKFVLVFKVLRFFVRIPSTAVEYGPPLSFYRDHRLCDVTSLINECVDPVYPLHIPTNNFPTVSLD